MAGLQGFTLDNRDYVKSLGSFGNISDDLIRGVDIRQITVYTLNVAFEWDNEKARRNAVKHGISFKTAAFAFDDPYALVMDDVLHSVHEPRQWLIGDSGAGILVVVFTLRPPGQTIRIISARRANRRERRTYECAENKRV